MKRAIITDLDGTFLDSKGGVPLLNQEILTQLKILKIAVTGKSLYSIKKTFSGIPYFFDYILFSNGAGIFDTKANNFFKCKNLSEEGLRKVKSILSQTDFDYIIQSPLEVDFSLYFYKQNKKDNEDFFSRYNLYKNVSFLNKSYPYLKAAQVVIIIPNFEWNIVTEKFFYSNFKDFFSIIRSTSPLDHKSTWIEICPRGVDKANSLREFAEDLQININESLIIGNDYNDEDMLNLSKYSYVVENAPNSLKKRFKVVPSNNDSGFYWAVKEYLSYFE